MNETLYNAAMDKITMSGECESRIIEAAMDITAPVKEKKRFKIRFIPVIAAAAVLLTGTITAADGFDWIKGFFANNEFEITNDVTELMSEISDFSYESNCGIKASPIGILTDKSTLYCMLNIDGVSADNINITQFYTSKTTKKIEEDSFFDFGEEDNAGSNILMSHGSRDSAFFFKIYAHNKEVFSENEEIFCRLSVTENGEYTGDYLKVNFKISDINSVNSLELKFDKKINTRMMTNNVIFDGFYITPFQIYSTGTTLKSSPFPSKENANVDTKITLKMKNGSEVSAKYTGFSTNFIGYYTGYDMYWNIDEPINPENIASIYLQGVCLYDCNAQ